MEKSNINTHLLESKMVLKGYKTRKEFAKVIGTTPHTIGNLLNGVYKPSYELMNAIYQELELTPEEGTAIFFASNLRETKVVAGEIA
ncbi:helix-turn-helix transcriptional regulator [Lysinibacillus sp. M3]|uniref:Helix-turn-helix transcriptional regulator n=1 Tax=Lysinibacillus zambalensis TaxID=3160866 RepID=A0ABV1MWL3_9BACI